MSENASICPECGVEFDGEAGLCPVCADREKPADAPEPLEPGVYAHLPSTTYHRRKLGVVSKTALDYVRRSPAHYAAWVRGTLPDEDSPALAFGRAFDCALLEPEIFARSYVEQPHFGDRRFKENKAAAKEWETEHAGQRWIEAPDWRSLQGMLAAVQAHPLASKMIRDGQPQLTLVWADGSTGLTCKSRLDFYVRELAMIVDVKTAEDASRDGFRKAVAKYGYHRQDALYRAAALELDLPVQHFVFLAVEKSPPYAVATYSLDSEAIGAGYSSVRRDIETLAECVKTGRFPGYAEQIIELDLPPWAA